MKLPSKKVCTIAEDLRDVKFTAGPYIQYNGLRNYII